MAGDQDELSRPRLASDRERRRRRTPPLLERRRDRRSQQRLLDGGDAFRQPILLIRWVTTTVGFVSATGDVADGDPRAIFWLLVILAYTCFRTIRRIDQNPSLRRLLELTAEAALMGLAVSATGYFDSPFVFSTLTPVAVAGFIAGFATALRFAIAIILAVGIPMLVQSDTPADDYLTTLQWGVEILLVGLVTGFARRISGDADVRHTEALNRMRRLADANELLFSLHQVAQELPASLDLDEALESTIERVRRLVDLDSAAIVLYEPTDDTWNVARHFGGQPTDPAIEGGLPQPVRDAVGEGGAIARANLLRDGGPGLSPRSGSGIYAALHARDALVGVLVIEHPDAYHFSGRDADVVGGFAEPAALAIDNARWFARLRTVGADEERTRIARDLHDRIGQSLAYLAFELDRIVRKDSRGLEVTGDLTTIREDVRTVVREVRDTLYDLRTDVSEERTVDDVLGEFASRVEKRSGMDVVLRVDQTARMPQLQERELWRIAQEAIINAERHSEGSRIDVFWYSNGREAVAEVRDDGIGMPFGHAGRMDSYGMLGMRERAASIGAVLSVDSIPQRGVTVRVAVRNDPGSTP
jgi:signal transduction histidine kinase